MKSAIAFLCALLLFCLPLTAVGEDHGFTPEWEQEQLQEMIRLVNGERAAYGLRKLSGAYAPLHQAAALRVAEIPDLFSHTRPDGRSCFSAMSQCGVNWYAVGENLAVGQWSAQDVVKDWMNSPTHRANILNPSFNFIGVAHEYVGGGEQVHYWAQEFSQTWLTLSAQGVDVAQGQSTQVLVASVPGHDDMDLTYVSSDPAVAKVGKATGQITGVKPGTARITITHNSFLVKAHTTVTVTAQAKQVVATQVAAHPDQVVLQEGETLALTSLFSSDNGAAPLSWKSSNKAITAIDDQGNVNALRAGKATLTLRIAGGGSVKCKVTVWKEPKKLTLGRERAKLRLDKQLKLKARMTPDYAGAPLFWRSSDETVATVDENGNITPHHPGEATITVSTPGGKEAACVVQVYQP